MSDGPFPPIADYAFLSDREVIALIAPSGDVEWLCLPRPDGPSIFGAMLDRSAGSFRVGPVDERVPAGRRYVPGTNVLETTWATPTGWLVVRDALLIGHVDAQETDADHDSPAHRADTLAMPSHQSEHTLLRELRCVHGTVDVTVRCDPMFDYGRRPAAWTTDGDVAIARGGPDDPVLRLCGDLPLDLATGAPAASHRMREGERGFIVLSWEEDEPRDLEDARERRAATEDYWRDWLEQGSFPDHRWRAHLQRSALVLKGLQYRPTGALLAAATTSLPELPGGERNWDYRYTWIRDSTFALWGLHTLGFDQEAVDFFGFVLGSAVAGGKQLQVLYGIGGETELPERTLDHLSGYEDSRPVRVGNGAYDQRQHDIWGAVLDSIWLHAKAVDGIGEQAWELLCRPVENAIAHWREPDRGIWEIRGQPQHFVSSKVMCWVACDRGARLAEKMGHPHEAERWQAEADLIRADVLANGVDEQGRLVQSYGSTALDASSLLAVLMRFLPADDPVAKATVLGVAEDLTHDGLVLRYRTSETDDGLTGGEGSFAICSFWLVSALVEIGEIADARRLCEKLISLASPLDLYAEEIDPVSGRHLGNFPQAFTHLALINAVTHLIRAEAGETTHEFHPN